MDERPMHQRPLVYIAGPYTHPDPVANTRNAIGWAEELLTLGVVPVVPHLTMLWHLVEPHDIEHWYAYDLAILARCDALLRIRGESAGADREVEFAKKRNIPVFVNGSAVFHWSQRFMSLQKTVV